MKLKLTSIACVLILHIYPATAQQIDSSMSIYANEFGQEKIHIHFDRSIYNKGETIWFKAYILAGLDPSVYSKNFYIDWYDEKGSLIKHTIYPIFESSTRGQYDIPPNYTGRFLRIKAYTKWMLNFDTGFIYKKDIRIDQTIKGLTKSSATGLENQKINFTKTIETTNTRIHFFPESGDLVNNVESRIAFLIENDFGLGVNGRCVLKDSKGKILDSFKTEHDGMGSFLLLPDSGDTYSVVWKEDNGKIHTSVLPQAKTSGTVLQVQPQWQKIIFTVTRNANVDDSLQKYYLIGHTQQNIAFKSVINLQNRLSAKAEINTVEIPTGVLQITLFDAHYNPLAERVVFINNDEHLFRPKIRSTIKGFGKKEKNTIEIEVSDTLFSNMSVAITDADLPTDSSSNIVSDLLLSGDVKGYIHNPAFYFSNNSDSVVHFLDLVMLTHGWRRFNWKKVTAGQMPDITYPIEDDYMDFKGIIYGAPDKTALRDQTIFLILEGKDSTKQSLLLPIDKNNNFVQPGILLYDTIKVYYQLTGNKKLTEGVDIRLKTSLLEPLSKFNNEQNPTSYLWSNTSNDIAAFEKSRYFYFETERLRKQLEGHNLQNVTVYAKPKRKEDLLDAKYATGLFTSGNSKQFDLTTDPLVNAIPDIFAYLQGRVAGLLINNTGAVPSVTWRGSTTQFFLNEMSVEADQLKTVSVNDVAYIKVFSPPFFGSFGGGAGGAIAVYTRKGGDTKATPGKGLSFQIVTGFTAYKEFYNPDYRNTPPAPDDEDARTTLYWNPYILTDKKRKTVQLSFYNNDISRKFRVILEGINSIGKLARIEKIIE